MLAQMQHILKTYGFAYAPVGSMRSCFDIMAEKKGAKFLIKAVTDIDSVGEAETQSIKRLSEFFEAVAYIVGKSRKGIPFPRGIGFMRYGITCISFDDFEAAMQGSGIIISRRFSGISIKVSGTELRYLRKLAGVSIRDLSAKVGISKESIQRYESGQGSAHQENLDKLEKLFGSKLSEETTQNTLHYAKAHHSADSIKFAKLSGAPFDSIARKRFRYEAKDARASIHTLYKAASFYSSVIASFDGDYPFFITSRKNSGRIKGISVISRESISRIRDEEDLLNEVAKR